MLDRRRGAPCGPALTLPKVSGCRYGPTAGGQWAAGGADWCGGRFWEGLGIERQGGQEARNGADSTTRTVAGGGGLGEVTARSLVTGGMYADNCTVEACCGGFLPPGRLVAAPTCARGGGLETAADRQAGRWALLPEVAEFWGARTVRSATERSSTGQIYFSFYFSLRSVFAFGAVAGPFGDVR